MTTQPTRKATTKPSSSTKKAAPAPSPASAAAASAKTVAKKRATKPAKTPAAAQPEAVVESAATASEPSVAVAARRPQRGKLAQITSLLEREGGVNLPDLMAATGWQAHSVRGALSTLKKKFGGSLHSTLGVDGLRIYRLEVN